MEYMLEQVRHEARQAVAQALKVDDVPEHIVEFANPKVGADLAIPCFSFAAALHKSPADIAATLATALQLPAAGRIEATGPYVNIWLKPSHVAAGIHQDIQTAQTRNITYGDRTTDSPQTVVVEFPSPNMAKPFSIGHLRPAIQGWAIYKLMQAMGNKVITDDHLGDSGTPFGKWVVGFLRYSSEAQLAENGVYELSRVYIRITKELKDEKEAGGHELADEVQSWLVKLEQEDSEAIDYHARFKAITLEHIHHVYKRLGIHTDYAMGEAGFVAPGKKLVEQYIADGLAVKQADGSVIIPLESFDTPMLALKSNGAANYATTDIATLDYRMHTWHPDKIIHVVGSEQQFHFNQLFALAKKLGYTRTDFIHYWFGMIDQINEDGTRSKMSSRKGVVLLETLLDKAEAEAARNASPAIAGDAESLRRIALGAVKFTDLGQDRKTNILFDWETMFNLQGYSCAYVQYAAVRINGILDKFGTADFVAGSAYDWAAESKLLLWIARYPGIVKEAADMYEPHRMAGYVYELARILNRYYENTPVGTAEPEIREARLWMLAVTRNVIAHALDLLGIQIPDRM